MKFIFLLSASLLLTFSALKAHTVANASQNKILVLDCDYKIISWSVSWGENSKGKFVKVSYSMTYDCGVWGSGEAEGSFSWYYQCRQLVGTIIPDEGTKIDPAVLEILTSLTQKELLNSDGK